MSNSNFVVKHGLTVGPMTVTASSGDIYTTGTITASNIATAAGTETFTNKTISLADNTITGTVAEFNAALSGDNFTTINGSETLSNKTFVAPALGTPASATLTNATGLPVSTIYDRLKNKPSGIITKHVSLINFDRIGFNTRAD